MQNTPRGFRPAACLDRDCPLRRIRSPATSIVLFLIIYMISRLVRCLTAPRAGYGLAFAAPSVAETLEQMIAPLSTPSASGPVAVVHGVASHIWCAVAFQPRSGSVDSMATDTCVDSRSSSAVASVAYRWFSA